MQSGRTIPPQRTPISWPALKHAAKQRLAVAPCNQLGGFGRQIGKPRPRQRRMLAKVMPSFRHIGVGSEQETVREIDKQCAPFGRWLAPCDVIGAKGEIAPEILVF